MPLGIFLASLQNLHLFEVGKTMENNLWNQTVLRSVQSHGWVATTKWLFALLISLGAPTRLARVSFLRAITSIDCKESVVAEVLLAKRARGMNEGSIRTEASQLRIGQTPFKIFLSIFIEGLWF